jgi:hypothetical protein
MVNKAVYYILKNDPTLSGLVGSKVYPNVVPEETKAPAVVFSRDSIEPEYDKSGNVVDISEVSIWAYALKYPEVIDIISAVRASLELVKGTFNGVTVISSNMTKGDEGYDVESDTYFQKITFRIKTSKT